MPGWKKNIPICLQAEEQERGIHLNSQASYQKAQWPNGGMSDNAFFCSNLIGLFHEEQYQLKLVKDFEN
ncbi:Inactive Tyrosine-Protein Kinase Prag1 [Manis pentadactyla]|nr:Inactive Tyrosine-Protein Kinase Prag1 [Manis pentadactyla]